MKTTAESEELDLSELDAMQREADNKVYALQSQISALEKENESLIKQIANASVRKPFLSVRNTMRTKRR